VEGLTLPTSLAVSPDGANIYTVSGFASTAPNDPPPGRLATFDREAGTGLTNFVSFLQDDVGGADGIDYPLGVATAADGRWVYATGAADDALAVFARDPSTGVLAFDRAIRNDSDPALLLDAAIDVAADPLGRFVYVVALNDGALTVFAPEPGAALGAGAALLALATFRRQRQRA